VVNSSLRWLNYATGVYLVHDFLLKFPGYDKLRRDPQSQGTCHIKTVLTKHIKTGFKSPPVKSSVADPDPHYFRKLDLDLDPDPH